MSEFSHPTLPWFPCGRILCSVITFWWPTWKKKFKGRKGFHKLILPPFNYKLLIGAIVSGRQENVWRVTKRICRWTWLLMKSNVPVVTMAQKTPAIFSLCVSVHIDRWIDRYIDWLMDFRILSPRRVQTGSPAREKRRGLGGMSWQRIRYPRLCCGFKKVSSRLKQLPWQILGFVKGQMKMTDPFRIPPPFPLKTIFLRGSQP